MSASVTIADDGTVLDLDSLAQTVVTSGGTTTITVSQQSALTKAPRSFVQTIVDNGSGTVTISKFIGG